MSSEVVIDDLGDDSEISGASVQEPDTRQLLTELIKTQIGETYSFRTPENSGENVINRVRSKLSKLRARARVRQLPITTFKLVLQKIEVLNDGTETVVLLKTDDSMQGIIKIGSKIDEDLSLMLLDGELK